MQRCVYGAEKAGSCQGRRGVGEGPAMAFPSDFQEGINPVDTLILNSWLPELGEDEFVLFADTKCWCFIMAATGNNTGATVKSMDFILSALRSDQEG